MIRKDNNNNKKNPLKWGLNPQGKKCSIYWSPSYLAQSKGIMWLLLCPEWLWLDSFWHNRLAYWNRNITVRWICSWLQKCICLNRNVPCNSLKHLLWAWKSSLLGKTYTDVLVLGSQDARASGDTEVCLEKGHVFMSTFELTMHPHSHGLEAECMRKAGFWDMLLTEVMGTEQGAGFAGAQWSYVVSHAREQALEIFLCQGSISVDTQSRDSFLITIISFKYCLEHLGLQGSLKTLQLCSAYSDWLVCCPPGCCLRFWDDSMFLGSPALLWCYDHKGPLSVWHYF